jgi:hypothetical protein
MGYFEIDTLGDLDDPKRVILGEFPIALGVKYHRLVHGEEISRDWPKEVTLAMSPDKPGTQLSSMIGNTLSFLLLHRELKNLVASEHERRGGKWNIEYLPFTLINHKGKANRDYFMVNPIGVYDCVNDALSVITYFKGNRDKVVGIDRLVLDPNKLVDAPPLFRVRQCPGGYFVDQTMKRALQKGRFSNLVFGKVETQHGE